MGDKANRASTTISYYKGFGVGEGLMILSVIS